MSIHFLFQPVSCAKQCLVKLSILNASSIFGRVLPNFVADKIGSYNMLIPMAFVTGVLIFAWLGIHDAAGMIVFAVLYGFFSGAYISLLPSILMVRILPLICVSDASDLVFSVACVSRRRDGYESGHSYVCLFLRSTHWNSDLWVRSSCTLLETYQRIHACPLEHYSELESHNGGDLPYFPVPAYFPELPYFVSRDTYTQKKRALGKCKLVSFRVNFPHCFCFASSYSIHYIIYTSHSRVHL